MPTKKKAKKKKKKAKPKKLTPNPMTDAKRRAGCPTLVKTPEVLRQEVEDENDLHEMTERCRLLTEAAAEQEKEIRKLSAELDLYKPPSTRFYLAENHKNSRQKCAYSALQAVCTVLRVPARLLPSKAVDDVNRAVNEKWPVLPRSPLRRFVERHKNTLFDKSYEYINQMLEGFDVLESVFSKQPPDVRRKLDKRVSNGSEKNETETTQTPEVPADNGDS